MITETDYCPHTGDRPYTGFRRPDLGTCPKCFGGGVSVVVWRARWSDAANGYVAVQECINVDGGRCDYRPGGTPRPTPKRSNSPSG